MKKLVRVPTAGRGPFPAVVFVSGFGMDLHESNNTFDEISKHLIAQKIVTVQFNFSSVKADTSLVHELPLRERAREFNEVLVFMQNQSFVDSKRIGVLAQSFGVPTVLCSTLTHIASLICVSGVYVLRGLFKEGLQRDRSLKEMRERRGKTEFHDDDGKVVIVDQEFWRSINAFDPLEKARRLTMPVMMIHGDQDSYTSVKEARHVYASILSSNKKLKIFKGGDHGIVDVPRAMREELLSLVTEWFRNTLRLQV